MIFHVVVIVGYSVILHFCQIYNQWKLIVLWLFNFGFEMSPKSNYFSSNFGIHVNV